MLIEFISSSDLVLSVACLLLSVSVLVSYSMAYFMCLDDLVRFR